MKRILIVTALMILNAATILPCFTEMVMFNTKTYKYHSLNCQWTNKLYKNR